MSYIIGLVRELTDGQWQTTVERAMVKFFLSQVFPLVQICDVSCGQVEFLSMSNLKSTRFDPQNKVYALVFQVGTRQVGVELHQVYSSGHVRISSTFESDLMGHILHRAEQQMRDAQKPFVLAIAKTLKPIDMDFDRNYDTQCAVQVGEEYRLIGYCSVALVSEKETDSFFQERIDGPVFVVDSEFSGVFCQRVSVSEDIEFLDEEHQINVLFSDVEPSFSLSIQLQPTDYANLRKEIIDAQRQQLTKTHTVEEAEYLVQPREQPQAEMDVEEMSVQNAVQLRTPKGVLISRTKGLSYLDELVSVITATGHVDVILQDLKKQKFSGRVASDPKGFMAQSAGDAVTLFDAEKKIPYQEIQYHVNKSNVTGTLQSFGAGEAVKDLLGTGLTSETGLVGITRTQIFAIDKRIGGKEATIAEHQVKAATYELLLVTPKGHCAVGNAEGDVSLFRKAGQKSLNNLPGCGEPLLSLNVNSDESLLVATSKSSIIVYRLTGKANGENMFDRTVKLAERERPIIVKVPNQTRLRCGLRSLLKPAFVSENRKLLVSGAGKCLLMWQLNDILEGITSKVSLVPLDAKLVGAGDFGKGIAVCTDKAWQTWGSE